MRWTGALTIGAVSMGLAGPVAADDPPAQPGVHSPPSIFGTLPIKVQPPDPGRPGATPTNPPLNGATLIDETYGDWTVACRVADGKTQCATSQAQGNRKTGEQVFAMQLRPPQAGVAEGTILMPFGLQLDAGAVLKLDGQDLGQGLRFSTCVPQGCLLPVRLPVVATDAIAKAATFTVSSLDLGNGAPVTFKISTNGFRAALDRTVQLTH